MTDITATQVLLAVSASPDPAARWHVYRVPSAATGDCLDQPILGLGTSTVIVSVNVFSQTSPSTCTSPYLGARFWAINKNDLVTGAMSPATYASPVDATEFSMHPVQVEGSSSVHYLVATYWPGAATGSSVLHLFTVTGTPPGAVTVGVTGFTMTTAALPPPAPQANSSRTIDTGDIRVADAVWSGGGLWFGFDEACPSDATRSCIRIAEIDTTASALVQDFDISVASKFVFYPGLRVDGAGDLAVVFGYSSSSDDPGVMATGRTFGSAADTFQDPQLVAAGTGPESPSGCLQTCRYGDYFGAALDPANASVVWMAGEMGTPSGWSSHVFAVSVKAELTLSYRLANPGNGYGPPLVTHVHGGVVVRSSFSSSPTTVLADPGTAWSVSPELAGSDASRGEVWLVNGSANAPATSGWANASLTRTFDYFHQYAMSFGFRVVGGGAYAIAPQLNGTVFGLLVIVTTPERVFLDAGTPYAYPLLLSGSSSTERWRASSLVAGTVASPANVSATYYHQFLVSFLYEVRGASASSAVHVQYAYLGNATATALNATVWADARAAYAYDAALAGATSGMRWGTGPNGSGVVAGAGAILVVYREQFLVSVAATPSELSSSTAGGGWYDAGTAATVVSSAPAGWRFDHWDGDASGSAVSTSFAVVRPMHVTAVFDAGLVITAGTGGSIEYSYGSVSGRVPSGTSATIYVPVGTSVVLTASPDSLASVFLGWSDASMARAVAVTVTVNAPASVTGAFGVNSVFVGALSIFAVLILVGVVAVLVIRRRRNRPRG